jgi:hypothetical protein
MSFTRRHSRPDAAQEPIVEALREAGVEVWIIGKPCDLLTLYAGRWLPLEVKSDTSSARNRKDQEAQKAFLASTGVPIVSTPHDALTVIQKSNALEIWPRPADALSVAPSVKAQ